MKYIELLEPNYEGVAKVLHEFVELYKVCENKEVLNIALEKFCTFNIILTEENEADKKNKTYFNPNKETTKQ